MHLIYLDESGNTGNNLTDPTQPIFVLCALIVPEDRWLPVETALEAVIEKFFPSPRPADFEVHANEIINARSYFRQFAIQHRLDFFAALAGVAQSHDLKLIYRALAKKRYARWLAEAFGPGVVINPHVAAFPLVAQVINAYLKGLPDAPLGILISDENKEVVRDVEKSIRTLRGGGSGALRLDRIVEKGFFIESSKSILLQLCDLCAYGVRRMEEQKAGAAVKALDQQCIAPIRPLIHRGPEQLMDVLTWLQAEQKKERPGS